MVDLKKQLLDLADTIRYWDQYDLTVVPNILKQASEKIGTLELDVIQLKVQLEQLQLQISNLEESEEREPVQSYSTNKVTLYSDLKPVSDRAAVKRKLKELGITFDMRDNTHRLRRRLQRALSELSEDSRSA